MTQTGWLQTLRNVLHSYPYPSVLIDESYQIVATNSLYDHRYGDPSDDALCCYARSHGYQHPCDQEGETCPMLEARRTGKSANVLHIHNTRQGREHLLIETIPISDEQDNPFYIEVMKPILEVSAEPIANKMIGQSRPFNELVELLQRVGATDINVLLMGPSGSGKELAAQAVHAASPRHAKPFVTVECSGLTDSLFESELFGHIKGAFTGAIHNRTGLVQSAEGGTLFLDEVGDVPLNQQVKLLRLIETKTFRPVGESKPMAANFRLICATHKNLSAMVARGEFREDLFHRISTFPIRLPGLNERKEDLPLLAAGILLRIDSTLPLSLSETALQRLAAHTFSGHVRELKNILERAVVLRQGDEIDLAVIERSLSMLEMDHRAPSPPNDLQQLIKQRCSLDTMEKRYLTELLRQVPDKQQAAEIAGCSVRTLYRKLEAYGINSSPLEANDRP